MALANGRYYQIKADLGGHRRLHGMRRPPADWSGTIRGQASNQPLAAHSIPPATWPAAKQPPHPSKAPARRRVSRLKGTPAKFLSFVGPPTSTRRPRRRRKEYQIADALRDPGSSRDGTTNRCLPPSPQTAKAVCLKGPARLALRQCVKAANGRPAFCASETPARLRLRCAQQQSRDKGQC